MQAATDYIAKRDRNLPACTTDAQPPSRDRPETVTLSILPIPIPIDHWRPSRDASAPLASEPTHLKSTAHPVPILNIPLGIKHRYIRPVPRCRDLVVEPRPCFLICMRRDLEFRADIHHAITAVGAMVCEWVAGSLETATLATVEADEAGG